MAIANKVGQQYPDGFSRKRLGVARTVVLSSTGNAVATIPILDATAYIIRQVTVANANASVATGNVAIATSSDGSLANVVSGFTALGNVTSNVRYQDLSLSSNCATNVFTAPALFVRVGTAVAGTVDVSVYGDVVQL